VRRQSSPNAGTVLSILVSSLGVGGLQTLHWYFSTPPDILGAPREIEIKIQSCYSAPFQPNILGYTAKFVLGNFSWSARVGGSYPRACGVLSETFTLSLWRRRSIKTGQQASREQSLIKPGRSLNGCCSSYLDSVLWPSHVHTRDGLCRLSPPSYLLRFATVVRCHNPRFCAVHKPAR
jgi:hypothetical protein